MVEEERERVRAIEKKDPLLTHCICQGVHLQAMDEFHQRFNICDAQFSDETPIQISQTSFVFIDKLGVHIRFAN